MEILNVADQPAMENTAELRKKRQDDLISSCRYIDATIKHDDHSNPHEACKLYKQNNTKSIHSYCSNNYKINTASACYLVWCGVVHTSLRPMIDSQHVAKIPREEIPRTPMANNQPQIMSGKSSDENSSWMIGKDTNNGLIWKII